MRDETPTASRLVAIDAVELVDVLFSTTELGLAITDADGRFVRVNDAYSTLYGYLPEELLDQPMWLTLPEELQIPAQKIYADYVNRRTRSIPNEWDVVDRHGNRKRAFVTTGRLDVAQGPMVVFTVADVTESVRQAQALSESEERLSLTVAASGEGIFDWDIPEDQLYLSDQMSAMIGLTGPLEPGIDAYISRIHPDEYQRVRNEVQRFLNGGPQLVTEYRLRHEDGHYLRVAAKGRIQRDSSGVARRLVGSVADVTEMHRLRDDLLRAERVGRTGHWRASLEYRDARVEVGALHWSEQTYRIHGQDPATFVPTLGASLAFLHADDRPRAVAAMRAGIETGAPVELEARLLIDGKIRHVRLETVAETDTDGAVVALFGTTADITEFVEQQHQLRQAQKLEVVGQLAGGVAHDFNNMLGVVSGHLELLQLSELDVAQGDRVEHALAGVQRASELTQRLLSFSGSQILAPVDLDVGILTSSVAPLMERVLPSSMTLETRIETPSGLAFRADRGLLESCLINLVVNARDAIADAGVALGRINICAYADAALGTVSFEVSDNGPGIPAQIIDHVCEPFFTTKEPGRGSGLGLSMVLGFAQQSGGALEVANNPHGGAVATLRLPTAATTATTMPNVASWDDPARDLAQEGIERVLLVDDNPDLRGVVWDLLTSLGHSVLAAGDVEQALQLLAREPGITVVLTDLVMPGPADGLDLLGQSRISHPGAVGVLMTGYTDDRRDDVASADDAVFLQKPFGRQQLGEALQKARARDGLG